MKRPTNLDAIDTSWPWTANEELYWEGDRLTFEMPKDMSAEEAMEWERPCRTYHPLREHTALFVEFSQTAPTRSGILKFATVFGRLGDFPMEQTKAEWVQAITDMRDGVAVWHAAEGDKNNSEDLRSAYKRPLGIRRFPPYVKLPDPSNKSRAELLEDCKHRLQIFVNATLREHATIAQLVLTQNGDFQLTFRPKNLLGAMWLQFAQAMAHNYSIKICRGCGRPFQTGAGTTRRADATTCKDSCRQLAYRKENNRKGHQASDRRAK